jgi:hypothetical protein
MKSYQLYNACDVSVLTGPPPYWETYLLPEVRISQGMCHGRLGAWPCSPHSWFAFASRYLPEGILMDILSGWCGRKTIADHGKAGSEACRSRVGWCVHFVP